MNRRLLILGIVVMVSFAFQCQSQVPVEEQGGDLMNYMQQIYQKLQEDEQVTKENRDALKEWEKMIINARKIAKKLGDLPSINHVSKKIIGGATPSETYDPEIPPCASSLDINNNGRETNLNAIKEIELDEEYLTVDEDRKIVVDKVITKPPIWMPTKTAFRRGNDDLVRKVSMNDSEEVQGIVSEMARKIFPDQMLARFNPEKVTTYLMNRAGIKQIGEGIISRPAAPQDAAFAQYANLGCDPTDEILFWSDPMVVSGYHPELGIALNSTPLKGSKQVDMDNAVSRGYSRKIDQRNLLQTNNQYQNPFKGYASRVVPGLIAMAGRGRLEPGEPVSNSQLSEAMRVTTTLNLLPSQNPKPKKTSAKRMFENSPVFFVVPVTQGSSSTTDTINLSKLEKKSYEVRMKLAEKRLKEIAKLKDENREGYKYVKELIDIYLQLEDEVADLFQSEILSGDKKTKPIPEVAQFRKDVLDAIERHRALLSHLEHQYDDLKHQEWNILRNVLSTRKDAVRKLMDNAAIRYYTKKMQEAQKT